MNLRNLLGFLVVMTGFVWAQTGVGAGGGTTSVGIGGQTGVKGVPYSAEMIMESTQILGDGNRIHRETRERQFRDSEGRTRMETDLPGAPSEQQPFQHVTVMDPLQRVTIIFDSRTKIATIHHWNSGTQLRRPLPVQPAGNTPPPVMPRPAGFADSKFEDLGTIEIEGFTAKGNRVTHTVPAGKIGNERPITNITETWMSPELQTIVLWKDEDPSGQRTRKMVNIRTTEPDPSLFQVPPDYTVKDDQVQK